MGEDIVDIAEDVCADIMEKMKRQAKAASKVIMQYSSSIASLRLPAKIHFLMSRTHFFISLSTIFA